MKPQKFTKNRKPVKNTSKSRRLKNIKMRYKVTIAQISSSNIKNEI